MPPHRVLLFVAAMLSLASGCALRTGLTIRGEGRLNAAPSGPVAVLRVTARDAGAPRSGEFIWGMVNTLNADQRFAELLAHMAADEAGMQVLHPARAAERMIAHDMDPVLQPADNELQARAELLGCSSYLTADISCWYHRYVFFSSTAIIDFSLACHVPGRTEPVWRVEVCRSARGMSDREVAVLALRETFQWLKGSRVTQ